MEWLYLVLLWFLQPGVVPGDEMRSVAAAGNGDVLVAGSVFEVTHRDVYLARFDADSGAAIWEKTYGWNNDEELFTVGECSDGTIQAVGQTWSSGNGLSDAYFLRTDADGELVWEQEYGGAQEDSVAAFVLRKGGMIAVGSSASYGGSIEGSPWALRVASDSTLVWSNTYQVGFSGRFNDVARTRGAVVAVGEVQIAPELIETDSAVQHILVMKIRDDGTELWQKTYLFGYNPEARAVAAMSNGGFVVAGSTSKEPGGGNRNGLLLRLASNGSLLWHKTYGTTAHDEFTDVAKTRNGSFVAVGTTYSYGADSGDIWIHGVTKKGKTNLNHLFGTISQPEYGRSIAVMPSGAIAVSGSGLLGVFTIKQL